jgi:hypothetical protein
MTQDKHTKELSPTARFMAWARRFAARLRSWIKSEDIVQDEGIRRELRELIETISPSEAPFMDHVGRNDSHYSNWTLDPLTAPKPYAGGYTEIITKVKGE